jgi:hypothetical protein
MIMRGVNAMKRPVLSAAALAVLSSLAFGASAQAAPLSPHERSVLARNHAHLRALERRARADGHVSLWERAQIRLAKARVHALAYRLRHN